MSTVKRTNKSKYAKVNEWIKTNIQKDDLNTFQNNKEKCEHVLHKLDEVDLVLIPEFNRPKNEKVMYQILYKLNYLNDEESDKEKVDRLLWLRYHKDEILKIMLNDSKTTNNKRIEFTLENMNNDLKTNYTEKQVRNFLTNSKLLTKHF